MAGTDLSLAAGGCRGRVPCNGRPRIEEDSGRQLTSIVLLALRSMVDSRARLGGWHCALAGQIFSREMEIEHLH